MANKTNQTNDEKRDMSDIRGRHSITTPSDICMEFNGNRTGDSAMITVTIDLTDPDDLMKKLEMLDLTDEETDEIFEKAQELNRWLRRELHKQNAQGVELMSRSSSFLVSAPSAKGQRRSSDMHLHPHPSGVNAHAHPMSAFPPLLRQSNLRDSHSAQSSLPLHSARQLEQGRQQFGLSQYGNSSQRTFSDAGNLLTKPAPQENRVRRPDSSVSSSSTSTSKE